MTSFLKLILYKSYVLVLMAFVLWSAQFIYTIIFWEFEVNDEEHTIQTSKKDSPLAKQRKIREYMDNYTQTKKLDLGDMLIEEQYEPNHFHHTGHVVVEPVLNGCDYCHTNLAHNGDRETRAFLNQHGYFITCETCHYDPRSTAKNISYDWLNVETERKFSKPLKLIQQALSDRHGLAKTSGNFGARIAPWVNSKESKMFLTANSSLEEAKNLLQDSESFPAAEVKSKLRKMHKNLRKDALECDTCHEKDNQILSYQKLGYPEERIKKLTDTAIVGIISKYKQFHFPNLFIRKDDREGTNEL